MAFFFPNMKIFFTGIIQKKKNKIVFGIGKNIGYMQLKITYSLTKKGNF